MFLLRDTAPTFLGVESLNRLVNKCRKKTKSLMECRSTVF